ncbi:uroporphyrinogen decarboxylase [Candidatus Liberibacter asiaticus]|uniref:Uroporphyrinogen decarboxylase n=4 Tax=Liberibacter asiaticus TaxID=34021 RepID=C6XFY2_LIBAP|nr:uroporphyrinogen decarboxylase [Candidatus Liberibacter asiaticus]ACT57285.1 uroporphyrinogen decarboxylase [Candidatus Liberibacter asiaticus str. psy62]AGH16750.1 uroporphyrinogen decarboxylase [Candidatus Liberibacter asiaticus str. gxpsy]ALK07121.1 uroporphyrinogen decarboxylase [Candidatus Liberibacter asiaticus]ASK52596.1 uroporphyrinogen decarboxylase [Candidatus Liberibacter asiaticus]AWL13920.1 uroporphyrinogen decarboxylase [Candidatus Liberibacter asiaticus]
MNERKQKILEVLQGNVINPPPIWLMRQAGRYLPEYRQIRKKFKNFLDMCYTPEYTVELTLQPIRRYNFDAAILFSDILVIADALGRNVRFVENEGPRMDPITTQEIYLLNPNIDLFLNYLLPIFQSISILRKKLPNHITLIGFCGAPWTVASYMISGGFIKDHGQNRVFAYQNSRAFNWLLDFLSDVSAEYLIAQIHAGVDVIQIFDTHAGCLGEHEFENYAARSVGRIISAVRRKYPNAKFISFAKGAGYMLKNYRRLTDSNAIGLDWSVPLSFALELQKEGPVQGNLDPMRLVVGNQVMIDGVNAILDVLGSGPFIFNLGHGITPQVDPKNVLDLVKTVRSEKI